jgi:hypothetical protein
MRICHGINENAFRNKSMMCALDNVNFGMQIPSRIIEDKPKSTITCPCSLSSLVFAGCCVAPNRNEHKIIIS